MTRHFTAPAQTPGIRGSRFIRRAIVQTLLALAVFTPQAQAVVQCDPFTWMHVRLDVNSANDREAIGHVEHNHFDADTENLVRGVTGSVGPDIDFLVRHSPNHHRGLAAMVRLALKTRSPQPPGVSIPVECYLQRALEFTPDDPEVLKIYGTYLSRLNRDGEALARFEEAEKLAPGDPVIAYNIGLLLAEKRDYDRARLYAKKAYAGGLELTGLRDKLAKQGQWR